MARKRSLPEKSASKPPAAQPSRAGSARLTFEHLVRSIHAVHAEAVAQVSRAVNFNLTVRNWLIGCYIAEYELPGKDRAAYGE
jgi:hypothetical protein